MTPSIRRSVELACCFGGRSTDLDAIARRLIGSLGSVLDTQRVEHGGQVGLDRGLGYAEMTSDQLVRQTSGCSEVDLDLSLAQAGEAVVARQQATFGRSGCAGGRHVAKHFGRKV